MRENKELAAEIKLYESMGWVKHPTKRLMLTKDGRVRSLTARIVSPRRDGNGTYVRTYKGRELKESVNNFGYSQIGHNQKAIMTHRLMAQTFIPNPENKRCVNHIDGDRSNNSIENLEWCTYSENIQHAQNVLHRQLGSKAPRKAHTARINKVKDAILSGAIKTYKDAMKMFGMSKATTFKDLQLARELIKNGVQSNG